MYSIGVGDVNDNETVMLSSEQGLYGFMDPAVIIGPPVPGNDIPIAHVSILTPVLSHAGCVCVGVGLGVFVGVETGVLVGVFVAVAVAVAVNVGLGL